MKKLLIKWFKLIPPTPINVFNVAEGEKYHVIEVEKGAHNIVDGLGLTPETEERLKTVVFDAYKSTPNLIACMAVASKEAKHSNELFFMTYIIAAYHRENNNPAKMIAQMIIGMGGKPMGTNPKED